MSQASPVYVGMDLGTYKTSVASSTGYRDVLQTAVGWPKDHIARTMLGRDVVFGNDIVEQRLALNIIRNVILAMGGIKLNGNPSVLPVLEWNECDKVRSPSISDTYPSLGNEHGELAVLRVPQILVQELPFNVSLTQLRHRRPHRTIRCARRPTLDHVAR